MSDAIQKLAQIAGPLGDAPAMIGLRCDLGAPALAAALRDATGCDVPDPRRMKEQGGARVMWMSPDELLILLPRSDLGRALAALSKGLAGEHHLAVDVSDMRAVFDISGPRAGQVLQKLAPVNFAALADDEVRRTRVAQVAAAFWAEGDGYRLVCFRSVAQYMRDLLEIAANGGALDPQ